MFMTIPVLNVLMELFFMAEDFLVLTGGDIVFPDGVMRDGVVIIEQGKIAGINHISEHTHGDSHAPIDCTGTFVCPGFVDLHNQGGMGHSVMDGTVTSVNGMCRAHASHGTTGLLLTPVIEGSTFRKLLPMLAETVGADTGGANVLGIHAEGPFTNPLRKGFMPESGILPPDMKLLEGILDAGGGHIRQMTIAPELDGALDIISRLAKENVVPSLGHSNATLETVLRAIDHGAHHVTHMFNAMSPLHHREPGLAGAALYSTDLSVEVIADGFHIHPWILGLILQNKGSMLTCLITDCMSVMGKDEGRHSTLGQDVVLEDGRLSLAGAPETLAGSVLTMDRAVGNMMNMLGISISDAVFMASASPAAVIGMENSIGRIEIGYNADFAILDKTYRTVKTIVNGRIVYDRGDETQPR